MNDWISIEDHLPAEFSFVLVYANGSMGCIGFDNGSFSDWNHCPTNNVHIPEITHWMPLPERPEARP